MSDIDPQGNPFFFGGPIRPPYRFIGREREQRLIFRRLAQMGCYSVVGERRIGKSSLLFHLFDTRHRRLPGNMVAAHITLQDANSQSCETFLAAALEALLEQIHIGEGMRAEELRDLRTQARIERE